jgi:DNA-binding transcriptional regulator/RsmH inhibitor MraZ
MGIAPLPREIALKPKFSGSHFISLESKNRIYVPRSFVLEIKWPELHLIPMISHRNSAKRNGTNGHFLALFEENGWRENLSRLLAKDRETIIATSHKATFDKHCRITVPEFMVAWLGVSGRDKIIIAGFGNHLELWSEEDFNRNNGGLIKAGS